MASGSRPNNAMRSLKDGNRIVYANLQSAGVSSAGGDLCQDINDWTNTISWTTINANDSVFQIDIDYSVDGGSTFGSLITGLTSFSSNYSDDTGLRGNTEGFIFQNSYQRQYRVKLMFISPSSEDSHIDTTNQSITFYSDPCI